MANNATVTVQHGNSEGTPTAAELPADFVAALADNECSAIKIETPIASGKKYLVTQQS